MHDPTSQADNPDRDETRSAETPVLLMEGPDADWEALAERLSMMGLRVERVVSVAEAEERMRASMAPIRAALLPAEFADRRLKSALKKLRRAAGTDGIGFIAVGPPADSAARRKLRSAGVSRALWEPFDDETLRFQVNRALEGDREPTERDRVRIPSHIPCRVAIGGRSKESVLYNLSVTGAFVQTPRASMNGARIEVELRLDSVMTTLAAEVVFPNVIGNLQRPNLPMGMGIRFVDLDPADEKTLRDYIDTRRAQLEV